MKKFLVSSLAVVCVFSSVFVVNVFAEANDAEKGVSVQSVSDESGLMPLAEETGYIYKVVNGVRYKRLWSYTYGRWIDPVWTIAP